MKSSECEFPQIIQGGMGIGVSNYRLARAVARAGGLGVVSGTAIDTVFVRRLQADEWGDELDLALASFPFPRLAASLAEEQRSKGGGKNRFSLLALPSLNMRFERELVMVLSSYVEVKLAREGHDGQIGMNLLEKIQIPTLPVLFGALLAGVDVVLMGAGVPAAIPGLLRRLATGEEGALRLHVEGAKEGQEFWSRFDPQKFVAECRKRELALGGTDEGVSFPLARPKFFAIVSSEILAKRLLKITNGEVDGFVVEHHSAGGHNAPPRRAGSTGGYGALDEPKLEGMRALGVPFWLAGGRASAAGLAEALGEGAAGIQVGTVFAFCEESGVTPELKRRTLRGLWKGTLHVETDFVASPTGYPFKVVVDAEQPGERQAQRDRCRTCDLGYLRQAYVDDRGRLGFRCPGEPQDAFQKKGGDVALCEGKLCLCNQLLATVGLGQVRPEEAELPVLTAGSELEQLAELLPAGVERYWARDVMEALLQPQSEEEPLLLDRCAVGA